MKFQLALITGATSGIGEALARLLATQGISLILTGRNEQKLIALKQELSQQVPVTIHAVDLEQAEGVALLKTVIQERVPDLLINNAGFGLYGELTRYDEAEQLKIIDVNIRALTELAMVAGKALYKAGQKGVIMNISSAAAFIPFPYFAIYAASKAYVNHFTIAYDEELKSHGIRVLAACPGQVHTHFRDRASKGSQTSKDEPMVMEVEFAAREIWQQIQKQQTVRIFDWKYRIAITLASILPRALLAPILKRSVIEFAHPSHKESAH